MEVSERNQTILLDVEARIMRAKARVAGMEAANAQRALVGDSPAYGEAQFEAVIKEEGLYHNQIWTDFEGMHK